ncbi:ATP-binding protein [Aurantimonas sp. VKM B-3413]|uniref:ATP-binding protein n=1 Tax=Aurantimonas sp. VKM B-3413 TaxID=2779401 RepID=UPI001E5CF32B|nr:ATP-binding protein [Aurantimonas sp. VKM B-3413]MCB8838706.1 ATP-binding protein [Aurantimonas sp. VKM B-3413]
MFTRSADSCPVLAYSQDEFGALLGRVLSPSHPLQSEEFLRGRAEQLSGIKKALYQPGRHVLIHGFRGVGKSSLAQTAAYSLSTQRDPILVGCDDKSRFGSVMKDIFDEAVNRDPNVDKKVRETAFGFAKLPIAGGVKNTTEERAIVAPTGVNEAVRLVQFLCEHYASNPVIVIDEFDQITSRDEQALFTNFIKQISDRHVSARFIFCGIGESVDAIMAAHGSADRYFHTVSLGQLPYEARFEIVTDAARRCGVQIDETSVVRIARISDGFPHYVHFITEMLFWRVYEADNGGVVTGDLFERAMSDAAEGMEMRLRGPYETATQKYTDYAEVLWAAADGHELRRRSSDIYDSYQRIMRDRDGSALNRAKFNQRINSLKKPAYASILTGSRAGWYEFTEKVVRGYVRLRAEQQNVILEVDHPAERSRVNGFLAAGLK